MTDTLTTLDSAPGMTVLLPLRRGVSPGAGEAKRLPLESYQRYPTE